MSLKSRTDRLAFGALVGLAGGGGLFLGNPDYYFVHFIPEGLCVLILSALEGGVSFVALERLGLLPRARSVRDGMFYFVGLFLFLIGRYVGFVLAIVPSGLVGLLLEKAAYSSALFPAVMLTETVMRVGFGLTASVMYFYVWRYYQPRVFESRPTESIS